MSKRVLDDKYILAIKAIWETKQFTLKEIGKIFSIDRTTVKRYLKVEILDIKKIAR